MFNTIILKCGNARFANDDMERFEKYDTICGNDSNPIELQRWTIQNILEIRTISKSLKLIMPYMLKNWKTPEHLKSLQTF